MAFDPNTARLAFDPSSAKPLEFDPGTAKEAEFDPETAEPAQASWGDTLKAIPSQIVGGAEEAAGGLVRAVGDFITPPGMDQMDPQLRHIMRQTPQGQTLEAAKVAGEGTAKVGETIADLGTERIKADTPENQSFWQKAVSTAGVSAGTMIPAGLAAFVTGQPGLVAASFGAQEFGRAYGDARAKGLDPETATRHATASGLLEAGTEYLPAKQLFKAGSGPFKRLVNFMAAELPGENIAELGQMLSERINGLDDEITAEQVIETIKLTSAATLLGGSAQSLAASGLEQLTKERPASEPVAPESSPAPEAQAPPESAGPTLEEIAQADGAELDAMVDEYLAEELPVPDIEAFNEEVAAAEGARPENQQVTEITPENTGEIPSDRRAAARPAADRRVNELLRRDWDSLSDDEKREVHKEQKRLINTDPMTGIPNRRAYDEAPKKKFTAVADADGLKWVNDNMGHPQGDDMLKQYAQAFQDEGLEVYRGGERGDELIVQSDDQADMEGRLAMAQKRLEGATVEAIHPDGSKISKTGIGFGYGTGKDYPTADERLAASKSEREAAGLRSTRGGEPAGVVRTPAQGNQNKSDTPAAQPGSDGDQGLADATGEAPASLTSAERSNPESQTAGLRSGDRNQVLDGQAPAGNQVPSGQVAFDPTTARPVDEQQKAPAPAETEVLAESGTSPAPLKEIQDNVSRATNVEQPAPVESTADSSTLHANPVTAVYKGYQRLGRATLKRVHDAFGWKMTPLGKLPAQQLYLKERYETLGKIADVENISKRIYETFRGLDASEAEKVYEYFTTKDADLSKLSDKPVVYTWKGQKVESTVRKQAETIKRLINKVGDNLVEKGLLSKESHEKYEDAYLPRVYLKHLLGPGASRNFAGGKKPSDMGYLKERKDIPQDVRELILGEITDPGYLASKSLGKSMRDLAILDWFEEIAQNPDWVMPDSLIDYKGSKASIFWLKAEAARIKEQIPYYTPANQAKAQTIVQQMDAIVAKGEAKLQKVTDDYRQAPDTAQYGRMRGMYLRKEIYNDIVGIPGNTDPNAKWWEKPFEYGGIGTKATQLWKMSKVALNPPTQIRNFISNGILLQLSGVGSHRVLPLMVQAIQEMRENGKHWRIAKKYGITASTFANNELYKIERAFLDLKARNAGTLSMAQLKNMAGIVGDAAGDMYQLSEGIWKTAKIIDAMKREGMSESDAVLEAQKWMYDYSLVPQTVRYFRNTPIGVPFLTFYYKTLPRMLEVMATAPHRFAPYVAIPALFAAAIAEMYDVDPEDVEKLKLALPEWLRDHGHLFFLPFKDKHGRWQAFDFSYLLPWSMFEQLKNNVAEGNVREAITSAGIIGGPVTDLVSAIKTGIDPFTKKEIADKSDPPVQQVMSWMNYLWSMAAPTWLTDNGFVGKMREAITNEVDKQGDPKLTVGQAALRFMGLNVYPIEPEASRRKNMSFMQFEIAEMEKRMNERLRDKNLTMDDKKDIRRVYKEMMNEKRDQLKDYREKSKIHPNLKADKIPDKAEGDHDA